MLDELAAAIGGDLVSAQYAHGEMHFRVAARPGSIRCLQHLRDEHGYQQLMDIAGVDYPSRPERFDVVYMLLSVTKNRRVAVKVSTDEDTPVPTVTTLWPNAGWLEREVFDMFGVVFSGNTDLRRILTDYGLRGIHSARTFLSPAMSSCATRREDRRVVYEPVKLAQDFRAFDFLSPWEGANYPFPRRKAAMPPVKDVTTTDKPEETGAGLTGRSEGDGKRRSLGLDNHELQPWRGTAGAGYHQHSRSRCAGADRGSSRPCSPCRQHCGHGAGH
jgi:NADH-quinone oxidoreductase subunit C